jgi:hypothetical protein
VATFNEIINTVRRRVADYKEDRVYSDEYYSDAVSFALSKLSHDFSADYATVTDVPTARVFLLTKLATIEMCYVRAAEFVDVDPGEELSASFHSLKVPDLEVDGEGTSPAAAAQSWLSLARSLQEEYDGELEHSGGSSNAAEIQTACLKRISLTTGGYRKYALDRGLAAVTVSAVVAGTTVTLSWSILYDETFAAYEVCRDTSINMENEERVAYITDNQKATYADEVPASGTYYYRVKTVNPNRIKTSGNTLTVVVP